MGLNFNPIEEDKPKINIILDGDFVKWRTEKIEDLMDALTDEIGANFEWEDPLKEVDIIVVEYSGIGDISFDVGKYKKERFIILRQLIE